jgi:hypothetical protein
MHAKSLAKVFLLSQAWHEWPVLIAYIFCGMLVHFVWVTDHIVTV